MEVSLTLEISPNNRNSYCEHPYIIISHAVNLTYLYNNWIDYIFLNKSLKGYYYKIIFIWNSVFKNILLAGNIEKKKSGGDAPHTLIIICFC